MKYVLKFTPNKKETWGRLESHADAYYFVRLGLQWPHNPSRRLIDETTAQREKAKEFDTEEDARTVLALAGSPAGWEVTE